ncbi:cation transporter [Clostridium nigeriense]
MPKVIIFFNRIDYLTLSFYKNALMGIIKILLGVFTNSVLVIANAFYNIVLCIGKIVTILNRDIKEVSWKKKFEIIDTGKGNEKESSGIFLGVTIILLGMVFIGASIHSLETKEVRSYHWVEVYLLTLCTFIKIMVNTYELIKLRKIGHSFLSIKLTNFTDGILSLYITQEAILSMKEIDNRWYYNGIVGISLSIIVCIIGFTLIFYTMIVLKSKGR